MLRSWVARFGREAFRMTQPYPFLPITVSLRRLLPWASYVGCCDIRVASAVSDSRECQPGDLFVAIRGQRFDGHKFIDAAIQRGATALLVEQPQPAASVPQCVVPCTRRAFSELSAALHGHPARHLRMTGVTGTNGKTTITWLMRAVLQSAGLRCGLLGTVEYSDSVITQPSTMTTPDPHVLLRWLRDMLRRRATHATLELSSHALDQGRAAGIQLDAAIMSNITQDHFDYHKNFDAYRTSKLRIFELLKPGGVAVINVDDAGSRSCLPSGDIRTLTFGMEQPADVTAEVVHESLSGSSFELRSADQAVLVRTHLLGRHNIENCLAVAAAGLHLGLTLPQIAAGIDSLCFVPGRMEAVECGQPYSVLVDYAHTEDALRRCLACLRQLTVGRVICVFGAGGDRDRTKRPLLGAAAAAADLAVLTSDNPRSEDPLEIIREVAAGFPAGGRTPHIELDRAAAIHWALAQAAPGDCVLIAGKGHETEQICGTERQHFDDREVVRQEALAVTRIRRLPRRSGVNHFI